MDFGKIKNLIKQNGDKVILIERGEPEMVVMTFQEYEKMSQNASTRTAVAMTPDKPRENRFKVEALELEEGFSETEFIAPLGASSTSLPLRLEDIRLEDLPI